MIRSYGLASRLGQSDDAVEGEADLARQILQVQLHELGDVELVFDDQYVRCFMRTA